MYTFDSAATAQSEFHIKRIRFTTLQLWFELSSKPLQIFVNNLLVLLLKGKRDVVWITHRQTRICDIDILQTARNRSASDSLWKM